MSNSATQTTEGTPTERSQEKTQRYGRGGPYPKNSERFDPLNGSPPAKWRVTSHVVGGNSDIAGSRRESVMWKHPEFGELTIDGQQPDGTFEDKEFSINCSDQIKALCDQDPENGLDRETAYDITVEIMTELAERHSE